MTEERRDDPSTHGDGYLVPGDPTESADEEAIRQGRETADQERAGVREQLSDATGAEAAEDPDLGVGLRGGGAERVRGYE
jgi:hypothetical protein